MFRGKLSHCFINISVSVSWVAERRQVKRKEIRGFTGKIAIKMVYTHMCVFAVVDFAYMYFCVTVPLQITCL